MVLESVKHVATCCHCLARFPLAAVSSSNHSAATGSQHQQHHQASQTHGASATADEKTTRTVVPAFCATVSSPWS